VAHANRPVADPTGSPQILPSVADRQSGAEPHGTGGLLITQALDDLDSSTPRHAPPAADPPTAPAHAVPSNACGGFHLKVVNAGTDRIGVNIKGEYLITVEAGESTTLTEWLPPQPKPPMPWTVTFSESDGRKLATIDLTGPIDQKVAVEDGQIRQEDYDIRKRATARCGALTRC
jgi:hypothetical protein